MIGSVINQAYKAEEKSDLVLKSFTTKGSILTVIKRLSVNTSVKLDCLGYERPGFMSTKLFLFFKGLYTFFKRLIV